MNNFALVMQVERRLCSSQAKVIVLVSKFDSHNYLSYRCSQAFYFGRGSDFVTQIVRISHAVASRPSHAMVIQISYISHTTSNTGCEFLSISASAQTLNHNLMLLSHILIHFLILIDFNPTFLRS